MQNAWEAIPLIAFFIAMGFIVKLVFDYKTRAKLIDKGMLDENIKYLYAEMPETKALSSLKWGMILIAIGLAVFVGQMVSKDLVEEVTIGAMFLFAGLGLLIYYFLASRVLKRSKQENSET